MLGNAENLRKLYVVNIDPEEWDTRDLLYRMPEHWRAVTVQPQPMPMAPGLAYEPVHALPLWQQACGCSKSLQQIHAHEPLGLACGFA